MLFNSYSFICVFLPVALLVYFLLGRASARAGAAWLFLASLTFYGWWDVRYVPLLAGSICFNFLVGGRLARAFEADRDPRKLLLAGIAANLGLLAYYKYANFFVANVNQLTGVSWTLGHIVLPIGISFFTFTQIAFLVDAARGQAREYSFVHYGLFVSYFPHLVAGPILHHKEMMPQFQEARTYRPQALLILAGLCVFALGLAKKVVVADSFAPHADQVFDSPGHVGAIAAWLGVLAYTLQIYFDFSGYSDMAVGLSLMVGVRLPLNFASPYKARNIVDFWHRWHMTLSRFLRDYLYVPLGGNRKGTVRRYGNLFATMLLGGLWHGAAWTFVIWGGLHGLYLAINHAWRAWLAGAPAVRRIAGRLPGGFYASITLIAVMIAWVFFRASSLGAALQLLQSMFGAHGLGTAEIAGPWRDLAVKLDATVAAHSAGGLSALETVLLAIDVSTLPTGTVAAALLCVVFLPVALLAPNTQELIGYAQLSRAGELSLNYRLTWQPSLIWATSSGALLGIGLYQMLVAPSSPFLYFNF